MEPWYKIATPRKEVREGRSFNPDEFAIALEQIVAGVAPADYKDPRQFFARTCFTRAFKENTSLVLRRLAGKTENTSPVQTLVTQFGGGKTHMLTALYHLASAGKAANAFPGVSELIREAGLSEVPKAKVAVFVGNAWDPSEGRETPWIDIARQLAGEQGVKELGAAAKESPPGTDSINRVIKVADGPVLLLFDEVLNLLSRHKRFAESMHAFLHNVMRGFVGMPNRAAVLSLPRSQVEMTDWDLQWQEKILKIVGAVAKPLIVIDEAEISEVVRRRLFESLGDDKSRRKVANAYADWCFERRAQLPSEWTAVDTATTEAKARDYLRSRFENCYPFHPATLSVFQRKWQALPQYQQTRGTLAMLAQWISLSYREGFTKARREAFIALGSAPLEVLEFRSVVLGQLGESRLVAALDADICGQNSHARALDADTKGPLRDIHRRVGTVILFESSGGQVDKISHLPELRFALGEPEIDTTSIDNGAFALEDKSYFIRRVGSDGFKISHQATMKKVVNDRRASLDENSEIKPVMRTFVQKEFEKGASVPLVFFPGEGAAVQDTPKLTLVIMVPELEWMGSGSLRDQIGEWTKQRGNSPRLYPGSLVWCSKKVGRDFREKVELWLAWKKVAKEISDGTLGGDFEKTDRAEIQAKVSDAEGAAKDEVWGGYRFVVISDKKEPDGLKVIDLGAGHSSSGETLCGRVIAALKSQALLNESVGAAYTERNWPPALKESGAWPLSSLRQSFLDGSLTRLLDPDSVLKTKIVEWVSKGEFGLASGLKPDGTYERLWFEELVGTDEIVFDSDVFLLTKKKAKILKSHPGIEPGPKRFHEPEPFPKPDTGTAPEPESEPEPKPSPKTKAIRLTGSIPPEIWNRFGTKIIPKTRSGKDVTIEVKFSTTVELTVSKNLESELRQLLQDLGISDKIRIE
jgi:hypothetical protein